MKFNIKQYIKHSKIYKDEKGISEVLGSILIMGIMVTAFAVLTPIATSFILSSSNVIEAQTNVLNGLAETLNQLNFTILYKYEDTIPEDKPSDGTPDYKIIDDDDGFDLFFWNGGEWVKYESINGTLVPVP